MSVNKAKYPFPFGGIVLAIYTVIFTLTRMVNTVYYSHYYFGNIFEVLTEGTIGEKFRWLWHCVSQFIDAPLIIFVFFIFIACLLMLFKLPQISSIALLLSSVGPFIWVIDYFSYFIHDINLYNAIWLLFDFFFWCAIVVLAIIGLDTFALFKRITVSYAWILPALFGTISFGISAIMDIIDIIKGFTSLSLDFNYIFDCFVQPLFSVFHEFIFLVGVVLTGFWFFKCTKAKVANFKEDINEIVNVPTEEQSSEVLEDIIDETAKEVKNENFIEVTKDKINEDTVVESTNINEAESVGIGDKLLRYQKMLDDGLISREDFEKLKKEIL